VTVDSIQEIIRELQAGGMSILITDHHVRETLQITDRSYVIRGGKVLCHGRPQEVLQNADAKKYYFGDSMDIGNGLDDDRSGRGGTPEPEASPVAAAAVAKRAG